MTAAVLVTGAAGNIGRKLRAHFAGLGWSVRALDVAAHGDGAVLECDLRHWDETWVSQFAGMETVVHLAGDPRPIANWEEIDALNIDLLLNVYEAAVRQGVKADYLRQFELDHGGVSLRGRKD